MEFLSWVEDSGFSTWLKDSGSLFAYDLYLTCHAIGMAAIVGLSAAFALRVLGVAPRLPLAPMEKFFPVMYAGFWLNAVSGVVLLIAYPIKAFTNPGFFIKMGGIVLAIACLRRLKHQVFGNPASSDTGPAPRNSRILAGALLFLWLGTITAGRLMAYHGIGHVEREAALAVLIVTVVMLLVGFIAARLFGWNTQLPV